MLGIAAHAQTSPTPPLAASDTASTNKPSSVTLSTVTVRSTTRSPVVSSGALGTRSALDTPFSVAKVTAAQLEEHQTKSLGQVFAEDASVQSQGGTYTLSAQALSVRGLTIDFTNNYKIDGQPFQMYGVELPLEAFESVQLLKGATGFLYGIGAPGGIVNFISKKPTDDRTLSVDVGYSSGSLFSEHLDAGGRFGKNDMFGYRFNVVHEQGETYNGAFLKRDAVALAADARLTSTLTWTGNFMYQERDIKGGVPLISMTSYTGSGLPSPISGSKDLSGYNSSAYYNSTATVMSTGLHWQFAPRWKASVDYGHSEKIIDSAYETLYLTGSNGAYSDRLNPFYHPTLIYNNVQSTVEGDIDTGPFKHHVVVGAAYQTLSRELNFTPSVSYYTTSTIGNLYSDPSSFTYSNSVDKSHFYRISEWTEKSIFASDTIDLTHGWSVLGGVRYLDYENENYATTGAQTSAYKKEPITPTVALMYKLRPDTMIYASYMEALEDGGTVGSSYANANEVLAPLKSKQYEIGIKTEHARWGANAALFEIKRGAAYADYSTNSLGIYGENGEVRYRGVELGGRLGVTRNIDINASATVLNAVYQKTTAALIGNTVPDTAKLQAVLGVDARIPAVPGLSVHADVDYTGAEEVDTANTLRVPSYTLVNAGASYRTHIAHHTATFRLEVDNLTGRRYWYAGTSALVSNVLGVGAPRTISLNARFDM